MHRSTRKTLFITTVCISIVIYAVSLFSPLITVHKLLFFDETISLISVLITLVHEEEIFLLLIIFVFTIILPVLKFTLLLVSGFVPGVNQSHKIIFTILEEVSKWAMLDVFVIALLVVIVKIGMLSSTYTHYGLYLFALSVLLSMLCAKFQKIALS